MKKYLIGSAIVLSLVIGVGAQTASALTSVEAEAIISALSLDASKAAAIRALVTGGSAPAASVSFSRNLTVGSTGSDVTALQQFLVSRGFLTMPAGTAYGYFGALTKSAVAAYQASTGLPSTGYFGPMTIAKISASGVVTVPSTPGTSTNCPAGMTCTPVGGVVNDGDEGQLTDIEEMGSIASEDADEGEEDVQVLGVEVEAEDSDMTIDRIDVDFTAPGSGSDNLDDYITEVTLWIDGQKVATQDVDEADEDDDVYSFRFSGLSSRISEGEVGEIVVAVSAVNNIDSSDTGSWTVEIPENGIRATDEAGISETYVSSSDDLEETFSVGSAAGGELDFTEADENPDAGIVSVSEESDTTDVLLLALELEADESDLTISEIPFHIVSSGANVSEIVKSLKVVHGSNTLDSQSISSVASTSRYIVFEDLDLEIGDGDTEVIMLYATINDLEGSFGEGDSVWATASSSNQWDVEDENGDSVTPSGNVTGDAQTFYSEGITVSLVSTDEERTFTGDDSGEKDRATYTIKFDVKAADEDVWLDIDTVNDASPTTSTDGVAWASTTNSTGTTSTVSATLSIDDTTDSNGNSYGYRVRKGDTATFTLKVDIEAGSDGSTGVRLTGFKWGTTTPSSDTSLGNLYNFDLGTFKTDQISLNLF